MTCTKHRWTGSTECPDCSMPANEKFKSDLRTLLVEAHRNGISRTELAQLTELVLRNRGFQARVME